MFWSLPWRRAARQYHRGEAFGDPGVSCEPHFVNPQTMQQKTLDLVGRRHTVEQTVQAFELARKKGFDNINMDLIAGLPGETIDDMEDTLRQVEALHPDSLTVHALAIKRAAKFGQEGRTADLHAEISGMVGERICECPQDGTGSLLPVPAEEYCRKF